MNDVKLQNGNNASEWHIVKEQRISKWHKNPDGIFDTYEATFIKRNDGMSFDRVGLGRPEEMTETYLLKGSFGEFEFSASRLDKITRKITDRYVVYLFSPYIDRAKERLIRSMAKDIESALLNYPVHNIFHGIPVKDVLFQTTSGYSVETLKRAEEIL